MNFIEQLETAIAKFSNPICMGMDPVLSRIPLTEGTPEERIRTYYLNILEAFDKKGIYPAAVKPNSAYFECISPEAMVLLKELIQECTQRGIVVVLDAKRGDIGKSSAAYATAAFDVYGADCVTVSPYMGADSMKPFLTNPEKGVFGLLRTSNPGAADFQDLSVGEEPLFFSVARKFVEWDNNNLGAVVGATNLAEMERIVGHFISLGKEIPFLIPGVSVPGVGGQQGGLAKDVINALRNGGSTRNFHLLNSSSGLNFAYEAYPKLSYAEATATALEALISDCQ